MKIIVALLVLVGATLFPLSMSTITDQRSSTLDGTTYIVSNSFRAATRVYYISTGKFSPVVSISYYAPTSTTTTTTTTALFATVDWYASASVATTTGTLLTAYCTNRNGSGQNASVLPATKVTHSPTAYSAISTSVQMPQFVMMGTTCKRSTLMGIDEDAWMLKPYTNYWFQVTPSYTTVTSYVDIKIIEGR